MGSMYWPRVDFDASTTLPEYPRHMIRELADNLALVQENPGWFEPGGATNLTKVDGGMRVLSMHISSMMLSQTLSDFRWHYVELLERLDASGQANKELCKELRRQTQRAQPISSIDASATKTVWRSLIDLDATCETQEVTFTSGGSVNVIEDHALALRLNGTIDWLLGAINLLRVQRSRNDQARVRLAPVLCLSESELVIIFELVAESEAPQAKALGWMRLSHVCGVWRNVLLGMSDLWGRDAYAFGAGVATTDILPRVESGLLSVTTLRPLFDSDGKLPAFCRGLVPFRRKAEFEALELKARQGLISDLNLSGGAFALPYLGRILGNRSQPHLRAVNIRVLWRPKEDETSGLQMPMAPHPNLRHVALVNIFIPFTLPRLVSLHVVSKVKGKHMPQVYLDALLDSLEASPTLKDLCILHLVLPSPPVARNITLPNLDTLCSDDDGILQHLHLPALRRALTIGSGSTAPET